MPGSLVGESLQGRPQSSRAKSTPNCRTLAGTAWRGALDDCASIAVSDGSLAIVFVIGALVSLGSSWVLVSRIERVGARLGLSEALLGMLAALAANAPEITAAVTALAGHQDHRQEPGARADRVDGHLLQHPQPRVRVQRRRHHRA